MSIANRSLNVLRAHTSTLITMMAFAGGGCGLFKPPTPPPMPTPTEVQVVCSVTRTECTAWAEDDESTIDEVNCVGGSIVSNTFTSTTCILTTPSLKNSDAQIACNAWCSGNEVTGGLYPLGFLEGAGTGVVCNATVVGALTPIPGACTEVAGTSNGASERANCILGGRLCEDIMTTEDGTTEFCSEMPEISQSFSGCFDPTKTTAQNYCEHSLQFPTATPGAANVPDQFPFWSVQSAIPGSPLCPTAGGAPVAFGIGEGAIGSFVTHGVTSPLTAKGGFITATKTCDSDNEFCSTTINDLQLQLDDIVVSGLTISNPSARLVAPVTSTLGTIPGNTLLLQIDGDISALGHESAVFSVAQPLAVSGTATTVSLTGAVSGVANVSLQDVASFGITLSLAASTTSPDAACSGETFQQRLLGFETLQDWTLAQGTLALSPDLRTQGCFGLEVGGAGYRTLNSAQFATPLVGTTSKLALDVFVPPNQPNQNWFGAIQMYLSCPSANFNNQYIGQAELTGKPVNQFSTVTYSVPGPIEAVLVGVHPDCFFSIAVNMNQTPTLPVLDNLRFH